MYLVATIVERDERIYTWIVPVPSTIIDGIQPDSSVSAESHGVPKVLWGFDMRQIIETHQPRMIHEPCIEKRRRISLPLRCCLRPKVFSQTIGQTDAGPLYEIVHQVSTDETADQADEQQHDGAPSRVKPESPQNIHQT